MAIPGSEFIIKENPDVQINVSRGIKTTQSLSGCVVYKTGPDPSQLHTTGFTSTIDFATGRPVVIATYASSPVD